MEKFGNGAGDGIRTRDINLGKVALYQLSYSREGNCFVPPAKSRHRREPNTLIVARWKRDCQTKGGISP